MSEVHDGERRSGDGSAMVVVLVHGFGGWSREEMRGKFFYWGAQKDLASELMDADGSLRVLTASVGPFSSVWDRAVELFYQIKGGRVDYGRAHSQAHKHERYGRTFPGLYPEWSEERPIHLLGHSMGGLTARALVQLLSQHGRDREEEDVFGELEYSDAISDRWVRTVTTVACPHDGTPLLSVVKDLDLMDLIFQGTSIMAGAAGRRRKPEDPQLFDFKLDQWGLKPQEEEETWREYRSRVSNSKVWREKPRDLCHHDLSLEGAAELNSWIQESPSVYYFSLSSCTTYLDPFSFGEAFLPLLSTNPMFVGPGTLLGCASRAGDRLCPRIDKGWRSNDGLVSTISTRWPSLCYKSSSDETAIVLPSNPLPSPDWQLCSRATEVDDVCNGEDAAKFGSKGLLWWRDKEFSFSCQIRAGVWNYLGQMTDLDHLACIGWNFGYAGVGSLLPTSWTWEAKEFYLDLFAFLRHVVR